MSHLIFPYPTPDQAQQAGMKLYGHLSGATPLDHASVINCAYVVAGFGFSFIPDVEPQPQPMHAAPSHADCKTQLTAGLKPLAGMKAGSTATISAAGVGAIDWKSVGRMALQFLLTLLAG